MSRLKQLSHFGQSIWIDYISRRLLADGGLQRLIVEDGVCGLTSNPAIFEKAMAGAEDYREGLIDAVRRGERDPEKIYEHLAFEDIRLAADQMAPVHRESGGRDGFVSLEIAPRFAHDTRSTISQAQRLWAAIARPNLMIKVPATIEGLPAIASAKLAYERFRSIFSGADWDALKSRGAAAQRLLWASTSTKNPAYPDTLYVDDLIGPDTVNTLPPATLDAFRDHGRLGATLEKDLEGARETMRAIAAAGISLEAVTGRLLDEGVRLFAEAYDRLLDAVRRAREVA